MDFLKFSSAPTHALWHTKTSHITITIMIYLNLFIWSFIYNVCVQIQQNPCKSRVGVAAVHHPRAQEADTGDPQSKLAIWINWKGELQIHQEILPHKIKKEQSMKSSNINFHPPHTWPSVCMHLCTYLCAHTCKYTYRNWRPHILFPCFVQFQTKQHLIIFYRHRHIGWLCLTHGSQNTIQDNSYWHAVSKGAYFQTPRTWANVSLHARTL